MGHRANPITAAAETPLAFDAHEGPGTVTDSLVMPRATQKIVPAQFQPAAATLTARIGPGVLQLLAHHGAIDRPGAPVRVMDHARHARAVLREDNFRGAEVVAARPPLAVE